MAGPPDEGCSFIALTPDWPRRRTQRKTHDSIARSQYTPEEAYCLFSYGREFFPGGPGQVQGPVVPIVVYRVAAEASLPEMAIRWEIVRRYMTPSATAGVLWLRWPKSNRASTWNCSAAASTTISPLREMA